MARQVGSSFDELNAWVAERTEGHIQKLIDPPTVDPLFVGALVNAVYFVGAWASAFDPKETVEATFAAPGGPLPARMMRRTAQLAAAPA
eukprot:1410884-Prymnesium_polylepis.1